MGVFSTIKDKIFGKAEPPKPAAPTMAPAGATAAAIAQAAGQAALAKAAAREVDVEAIMENIVKAKGIKLNWRVSIVDLMKALDMDSSLAARKELAAELNYTGTDPDGSAEKNIWLHKALMKKLAENGGKIPQDLLK
jgi:hypothetical protein